MKTFIDVDSEVEIYRDRLESLNDLAADISKLEKKDQDFADSLLQGYLNNGLSERQWEWVGKLNERISGTKPLYGDFRAIRVAFQIAGEYLKIPKIRLMTKSDRYVQLNFLPKKNRIEVFVDGWQGHGKRKFAGVIEDDMIKPYSADRLSVEVHEIIEQLAHDPANVAKAMAAKLGVCMYCGQRLSDPVSKRVGYGPVCAGHYGRPHDNIIVPVKPIDLKSLFA